jgi:C-terminal processing protease CtpA/Prc
MFLHLRYLKISLFVLFCMFSLMQTVSAQKMDRIERDRMKSMLSGIKTAIKKDYYDENYHGIDLDARFEQAKQRLEQMETVSQAFGVIAQVLIEFNDSHLYFLPPSTNLRVEYGWRMRMIGDKCFVTTVKPKSDADVKGLKAGDQILAVENFKPSRKEFWKMMYYYNVLGKRAKLRLTVLSPGVEQPREIEIESKIKQMPGTITAASFFTLFSDFKETDNDRNLFEKVGSTVIWRMPGFDFDPAQVDTLMERVKKGTSLVLDLRGNGGGYVETMERLSGFFFDKDLKIADLKGRKEMKPQVSKTRGKDVFTGKLIVLVDSRSGSASEIFARLVQLEKRGIVLGDVSAGAVMQSRVFQGDSGSAMGFSFYGASITNADVIMSDGKTLEHTGVIPDELIFPTGEDLAMGRDPVLAKAVQLLGGNLTPEEAGKFFPYDWKD